MKVHAFIQYEFFHEQFSQPSYKITSLCVGRQKKKKNTVFHSNSTSNIKVCVHRMKCSAVLSLLEAILFPLVEQICFGTSQVDDFRTAISLQKHTLQKNQVTVTAHYGVGGHLVVSVRIQFKSAFMPMPSSHSIE